MKSTDPYPFASVGDASENHAFLTTPSGHDVARLERITPEEWPDLEDGNYLSDEDWQTTIDLAHYAPEMKSVILAIADKLQSGISPLPSDGFWDSLHALAMNLNTPTT